MDNTAVEVTSVRYHETKLYGGLQLGEGREARAGWSEARGGGQQLEISEQILGNWCKVAGKLAANGTRVMPEGMGAFFASTAVDKREQLISKLEAARVPTAVHYPLAIHQQPAFPGSNRGLSHSERAAAQVMSLPMHAYLKPDVQLRITDAVCTALT